MELYVSLRRRGFIRVATPATCSARRREHSVGLIAVRPRWRRSRRP
jgi:hypothetical protein